MPNVKQTNEVLECHPSSLFYAEEYFTSNNARSYGLDPKQINDAEVRSCYKNPGVKRVPISNSESEKCVAGTAKQSSKLNSENLANRQKRFIETEMQLETLCNNQGVEYVPPSPSESKNSTASRRRKLRKNMTEEQTENEKKTKQERHKKLSLIHI